MGDVPKILWVGLGAGVLAFVVSVSFFSASGGSCSYVDYAALVLGAAAVMLGLVGLVKDYANAMSVGLAVVVILLGIFQFLRGLGLILGPC